MALTAPEAGGPGYRGDRQPHGPARSLHVRSLCWSGSVAWARQVRKQDTMKLTQLAVFHGCAPGRCIDGPWWGIFIVAPVVIGILAYRYSRKPGSRL